MKKIYENIIALGDYDQKTWDQIVRCAESSDYARLMADAHLGYTVPIGGVLVSKDSFTPAVVGFDIACGLKAVRTDADPFLVRDLIPFLMDQVVAQVSFGVGRHNNTPIHHSLFDSELWSLPCFKGLKDAARSQLGTVGGGNHFVNIFSDQNDQIWIGCHFGSRGLGHKTATWFLNAMGAKDDMESPPILLHEKSDLGEQYIKAIQLAGEYAYAGRDWVCDTVANILGAEIIEEIHQHHNFLWKEEHNGEEYWVGRKGSTPAFPGQRSMIGSSMCEPSLIIEGVDTQLSKDLFYSTIHGAGRAMSRNDAKGKRHRKTNELILGEDGLPKKVGLITPEMMSDWVKKANIELRGADVDESPGAYKRLDEVLPHQEDTIKVVHTLTPIGVAMCPSQIFDPYRD